MGAAGAGMATFISNCVACMYFLILLFVKRGKTNVCIQPKMVSFRAAIFLGICAVGVPAMIQNLLNVVGMTILNNFVAVYGADAVAAMGIAHKIQIIPWQITFGISQGIMPLISYNYASGNSKRLKDGLFFVAKISFTFITLVTILLWIFSGNAIGSLPTYS